MVVTEGAEKPNEELVVLERVTVTPGDGLAVTVVVRSVVFIGGAPNPDCV
jgi:hypothetical protein